MYLALSHSDICQACDDAIKDAILDGKNKVSKETLINMLKDRHDVYRH